MNSISRQLLRVLRWLLLTAGAVIAAVVIAAGLLVALLQDSNTRPWLLQSSLAVANQYLPLVTIEIDGIESNSIDEWQFDRLQVYYQQRLLLDMAGVDLAFDGGALWQQQLSIHRLAVERIAVYLPESEPTEQIANGKPLISYLDFRPWQLLAAQLRVDQLQLFAADGVLLVPELSAAGELALWKNDLPLQGQLVVETLATADYAGRPTTSLQLNSELNSAGSLQFSVRAKEAVGGWLGELLAVPGRQPLSIDAELELLHQDENYQLALTSLRFPWQGHQCEASGELVLDRSLSALTVQQGQLLVDGLAQSIAGSWNAAGLNLEFGLQQLPLDVARPWLPAIDRGWATGKLALQGPPQDLTVNADGQFAVGITDADQYWQAQGRVDGSYRSLVLQLDQAQLDLGWQQSAHQYSGSITGTGTLDFERGKLNLHGSSKTLDSGLLMALLQRFEVPVPAQLAPLNVVASVENFAVSGPLIDQGRQVRLALKAVARGAYGDTPLQLQLDADGFWQQFHLHAATLTLADTVFNAGGDIDFYGSNNNFDLQISQFHHNTLPPSFLPVAVPDGLMFSVSGETSVKGKLAAPTSSFTASAKLQSTAMGNSLEMTVTGHSESRHWVFEKLNIQTEDAADAVSLQLAGELDMQTKIPAMQWQLKTADFPLALLGQWGWPDVGGYFSSEVKLTLPGADAVNTDWIAGVKIAGDFDYHSGDKRMVAPAQNSKRQSAPTVRWQGLLGEDDQGRALTLASRLILLEATAVDAGQLDISVDKQALADYLLQRQQLPAAAVNTELDLRALAFLLPQGTELAGVLKAAVTVAGTVETPQINGELSLHDGRLSSADLGVNLRPIVMSAEARGQLVEIHSLRAEDGRGGKISAQGQLAWNDLASSNAVDVVVKADRLNMIEREEVEGEVSGQLQLSGGLKQLLLAGDLRVEPLTVSIDGGAPGADIPSIDVSYQRTTDIASRSWLPVVDLAVDLRADRRAYLRGRGLDAELAGKLHIGGTVERPVVSGTFTLVRGNFELLGNRFALKQGKATLSNESLVLLATGELKKGDKTITATLVGSNEQIEFTLTSDPEMPEDEILSWMMFGKSIEGVSGAQALQLATAISTLRGGGFDPIGKTRDMLGVDTLTLDTAEAETGTGVSVGAGKYLTERVYLEIERSSEPTDPWRSNLTIELTPRLSLRSSLSTGSGSEGVELEWRRDF